MNNFLKINNTYFDVSRLESVGHYTQGNYWCRAIYKWNNYTYVWQSCCTLRFETRILLWCKKLYGMLKISNNFFVGSCIWLITATILRLPVSATHSIVGATVGFALAFNGYKGINLFKLFFIGIWLWFGILLYGIFWN